MDPRPPPTPLRRLLRACLAALLIPVLLFEEWGWEPLAALVARLAAHSVFGRIERWVRTLPSWAALLAFFAPMLLLLPVKLAALLLFGAGHVATGLAVLVAGKLVGTALVARLFQLTQPALRRIPAFARWYPRWKAFKDRLLCSVRASAAWRMVRSARVSTRRWWRTQMR